MIRDAEKDNLTINVFLKNGRIFLEHDIPPNPLGDNDQFVAFWFGDVIRVYPMSEVAYFELVP